MHFRAPDRPEPVAGGAGYGIALVLTTAGTTVLGVAPRNGVALTEMGIFLLR